MQAGQISDGSAAKRVRPRGMMAVIALIVIVAILAFSLQANRSRVTQMHQQTARLQRELAISRSALSALNLRIVAANGFPVGWFERTRDRVVAKQASLSSGGHVG